MPENLVCPSFVPRVRLRPLTGVSPAQKASLTSSVACAPPMGLNLLDRRRRTEDRSETADFRLQPSVFRLSCSPSSQSPPLQASFSPTRPSPLPQRPKRKALRLPLSPVRRSLL